MKLGIIGDPHLTKSMGDLTSKFRYYQVKAFEFMYRKFNEEGVNRVVILGDILDKPSIDADSLDHVAGVLRHINTPTHILLGNHEAVRGNINILHCLKYHPMLTVEDEPQTYHYEGTYFNMVPYCEDLTNIVDIADHVVFTHHDLYIKGIPGGIDPSTTRLGDARRVFNGHVHDIGHVTDKILNVGSCFELGHVPYGEHHPKFYVYDTVTDTLESFDQPHTLRFVTVDQRKGDDMPPPADDLVVRIQYDGDKPVVPGVDGYLRVRLQKIAKEELVLEKDTVNRSEKDVREVLDEYVKKYMSEYTDAEKQAILNAANEAISECMK